MNVYKGMNCCRSTLILKLLTAESLAQSSVETTAKVQVYTCAMSVEVWALRVTMVVTQADDRAATHCLLCMYNARRSSKNCKIEPNIPIRPREANNSQMPSAEFDYPIQITITVELHILVG